MYVCVPDLFADFAMDVVRLEGILFASDLDLHDCIKAHPSDVRSRLSHTDRVYTAIRQVFSTLRRTTDASRIIEVTSTVCNWCVFNLPIDRRRISVVLAFRRITEHASSTNEYCIVFVRNHNY